jgi:hypothetical protein
MQAISEAISSRATVLCVCEGRGGGVNCKAQLGKSVCGYKGGSRNGYVFITKRASSGPKHSRAERRAPVCGSEIIQKPLHNRGDQHIQKPLPISLITVYPRCGLKPARWRCRVLFNNGSMRDGIPDKSHWEYDHPPHKKRTPTKYTKKLAAF